MSNCKIRNLQFQFHFQIQMLQKSYLALKKKIHDRNKIEQNLKKI